MPTDNAIAKWLKGKRTYAVAAAILLCGMLRLYGVQIPEFLWAALAALGLGFLRSGVDAASVDRENAQE